ncbi:TPA: hypothetical protein ACHLBR_004581, partial [Escherichia coli]
AYLLLFYIQYHAGIFLYINRWVLLLKCNNEAGMLFVLQVACAVSANYLESGFYTEVIIHKYTNNQTINIKYIFFLFKMDTNKVLMLPAFLMISRYTKP